MIVGIGVDVVDVDRWVRVLARTPRLRDRLFSPVEREDLATAPPVTLAGRFAAKEAVAKALGAPPGLRWHDCRVVRDGDRRPVLELTGSVAAAADRLGAQRWHLSVTHDGGLAMAFVVAESA